MNGLGIDFGASEESAVPIGLRGSLVPPQRNLPPKSSRRRAFVRHKPSRDRLGGKSGNQSTMSSSMSTTTQLPSMPLRENRSIANKSINSPTMYVMKHPLPAKPTVPWSYLDDVQPVSATRREDTPSDTSTPAVSQPSTDDSAAAHPGTHALPLIPPAPMASMSPATLAVPTTSMQPVVHHLPSKPAVPIYPVERDERVGIEVFMDNDLVVEGGSLHGCIRLNVPNHTDPSSAMLMAQPRVRLIGYECLPGEDIRHIFYRHMTLIDGDRSLDGPTEPYMLHGSSALSQSEGGEESILPCFASLPDTEGYYLGQGGVHVIPFSMSLPMGKGAKGGYHSDGCEVGYILIASVRVKAFGEQHSGVALCFQKMEVHPYLNPTAELASAPRPIISHASTPEAEARNIRLAAALHRETWVAGQRVYFEVSILNGSTDLLNVLRIALVRTETLYKAHDHIPGSKDILSHSSTILLDETLAANQLGHWWSGAPPGRPVHFPHSLQLPSDLVTVDPGRHVSVQYALRVGVGADTSTLVEVDLPVRIIQYVSIDPPPPRRTWMGGTGLLGLALGNNSDPHNMVERLQSLDLMRSPMPVSASDRLSPHSSGTSSTRGSRTAQHKRSLDFINSAIRSATARHTSPYAANEASPAGLGIELLSQQDSSDSRALTPMQNSCERISFGPSLPVVEVNSATSAPEADISLPLGDETVDDVELFFGSDEKKTSPDDSNSAQRPCLGASDAHTRSDMELEPSPSSSQLDVATYTGPSTPKRERIITGPASVPRTLHPKSSFTFATNASPLKVRRSNTVLRE